MNNPRITTTCTYDDGTPMSVPDQRWYLALRRVGFALSALVVGGFALIVVLGGWQFVVLVALMAVGGFGLIRVSDPLEQRSIERKARRSRDKTS